MKDCMHVRIWNPGLWAVRHATNVRHLQLSFYSYFYTVLWPNKLLVQHLHVCYEIMTVHIHAWDSDELQDACLPPCVYAIRHAAWRAPQFLNAYWYHLAHYHLYHSPTNLPFILYLYHIVLWPNKLLVQHLHVCYEIMIVHIHAWDSAAQQQAYHLYWLPFCCLFSKAVAMVDNYNQLVMFVILCTSNVL